MDKYGGNPLPDEVLDAIRETGVALKGPITTPVGGGFRSVNVALRKSLDLYGAGAALQDLSRRAHALRRRRPDHRPREHRGPLRGDRVRAGLRRGARADRLDQVEGRQARARRRRHLDQADLDHRHAPDRPVRLRLCAPQRPQQGHRGAQGEHHEVLRRPLSPRRAGGRRRERRHRVRRPHRRQHVHAARPAAGGVRRARAAEPVRRRPLRSLRRDDRRPRARSRRELRRGHRDLRADARLGAEVRRPEQGQSDGADALRDADAAPPRRATTRRTTSSRRSPRSSARARASPTT